MPIFDPTQFASPVVETPKNNGGGFDPSQFAAPTDNSTDSSLLNTNDVQPPSYQNTTSFQGNAASNAPGSFWNTLSEVGKTLFGSNANEMWNPVAGAKHIGNVVGNLAQIGIGAGEALAGHVTGHDPSQVLANDKSFMGESYGKFENAANSFLGGAGKGNVKGALIKANNDPAGFLMDLSMFLDAGGAGLKSFGTSSEAINAVHTAAGTAVKMGDFETAAGILQKAKELGIKPPNAAVKVGEGMQTAAGIVNPVSGPIKAAGAIIDSVGGKIEAPASGSVNTKTQDAMAKLGIDPSEMPLSGQTDSKFLQQADALAAHGLGGESIVKSLADTRAKVNDFIESTVKTITPDSVALSPSGLGGLISTGQETLASMEESDVKNVYDNFSKANEEAPILNNNTVATIQKYLDVEKNAPASVRNDAVIAQYQSMLDDLTGQNSTISDWNSKNPDHPILQNGAVDQSGMTFGELQKMRTNFMRMIKNPGSEIATGDQAQFQGIASAMRKDMNATVSAVDPALGKQLSDMQDTYRTTLGKFNSKISTVIKNPNTPPEAIVKSLFDPKKPSQIQNLMDTQPPDVIAEVRAAFLTKLINDSTDKDGNFDIDKFNSNKAQYDPNVIDSMFTPEQKARLDAASQKLQDAKVVQQALKQATEQIHGGSRTSFNSVTLRIIQQVAALGPAVFGFLTGNHGLSVSSILQGLGTAGINAGVGEGATMYGMAKLLDSAWGKKWLTNGFNTNIGKTVQQYAPELGDVGKISNAYEEGNGPQSNASSSDVSVPDVPFQYPPQ